MSTEERLDWRTAGLFGLGESAQTRERYSEAAQYYREVLARAPEYFPAEFNLAVTKIRLGRPAQAAEQLERLLKATPEGGRRLPIRFNLVLARAYEEQLGPATEAAYALVVDLLADAGPSALRRRLEGPALALLAVIAWRASAPNDDLQLRSVEKRRREELKSREELLARLEAAKPPDTAIARFAARTAREASVDEPRTLYLLACYPRQHEDPEQALDDLEDALSDDPGSIEWARRDPLLSPLRRVARGEFRTVIRWARVARDARAGVVATSIPDTGRPG